MARLTRAEQTERNRELLLKAARRVFSDRGYHGATLEKIADDAELSKGAVYSQFSTKADLFLALLEQQIQTRTQASADAVRDAPDAQGMAVFLEQGIRVLRGEQQWRMAALEFRIHAAREPELNRRYLELHRGVVGRLADILAEAYERAGEPIPLEPRQFAEFIFATSTGFEVEQFNDPDALGGPRADALIARFLSPEPATPRR